MGERQPPGNSEEQLSKNGRRVEKTGNRVEEDEKQVGKSGNRVEKSGDPLFDSGKELFKSANQLFGNANPLLINRNERSKGEIDVEQRKDEDRVSRLRRWPAHYQVESGETSIDGGKTAGERLPTQARREAQARQRAASREGAAIKETSRTINPRRPKMKRKITTELLQFKKLDQICDFGVAKGHRFAPGTPGADVLAAIR